MSSSGQLKTWSAFGNLRRKPTEYEIVTHDLHYHAKKTIPFELGPNAPLNRWYMQYRDGSPLQCSDWNRFRDPAQTTYRKYNIVQDDAETYVDELLDEFERRGHDRTLGQPWLSFLRQVYGPFRFLGHGLQITSAYLGQIAPSSYISNCAFFETANELRRVQRTAYRLKQLDLAYPDLGFGREDRHLWENEPAWQPARELIERLLVAYDWGEAFTARNLVVKPVLDELFLTQMGALARRNGDDLLAMLNDNLHIDSLRSRQWSSALVKLAIADRAENAGVLNGWVQKWTPLAYRAVDGVATLFTQLPTQPLALDGLQAAIAGAYRGFLTESGLTGEG